MNLEVGVLVRLLLVRHVVPVASMGSLRGELWGRRKDLLIGVEGPQSSMEGGVESVFLLGRGRRGRTCRREGSDVGEMAGSGGREDARMMR